MKKFSEKFSENSTAFLVRKTCEKILKNFSKQGLRICLYCSIRFLVFPGLIPGLMNNPQAGLTKGLTKEFKKWL